MSANALRILIVEDNEDHLELIRCAFASKDNKFHLTSVGTLAEAREILHETTPDLMLTDYCLPDGEGIELLPGSPDKMVFPIAIMTSQGDEKIATAVIKAGALDYIVKSVETFADMPHIVAGMLREWSHIIKRRQAEDALRNLATTFSAVTGKELFAKVTKHLAGMLTVDYAIIGELTKNQTRVNVVGGYAKGQIMKLPFTYTLAGTPCEHVIGQSICKYSSGTQERFPKDALLAELSVEGYIGAPLFDSSGLALGIMLVMHCKPLENIDVIETFFKIFSGRVSAELERKQAEDALHKLSSAIKQSGEAIVITDREGLIEYANPAFEQMSGYAAEEAIGQTPRLLKSGNQDRAFYKILWDTITNGKTWHGKVLNRKKDGSFYPAMLTIAPIFDQSSGNITHFVGTQSDLTELENMQARFHQAQKMEAIGIMVGGVAHNFNNMLAGIDGNLWLAKKKVQDLPDVLKKLTTVEELSHDAADMIQQLLTFSRKGLISMQAMDFGSFIRDTLKAMRISLPEDIAIQQDMCSDDLQVKGDATQLHQIFMNLLNNARDALTDEDEPNISIRLDTFHADATCIERYPDCKVGAYAHLSVEDNGCGIPAHQLEHLFEPFFTTKEQGQGTGLGLAMTFGSVETHHGFVTVESVFGKGSTFHIYLPLLTEDKRVTAAPAQSEMDATGQGEALLVADDEQMVRDTMGEVLKSFGYQVFLAEDGLAAEALFKEHQEEIALAMLDVVMPHGGGMPLAARLREINPDIPIIFLTGYDKDKVLDGDNPLSDSDILTKPVNFDVLSHSIRKLLD